MTISLVQSAFGIGTATFGSNVTTGNTVAVTYALSTTISGGSDTFTESTFDNSWARISYVLSSAGGYTSVSLPSASTTPLWIYEISGVTSFGNGNYNSNGPGATTWTSGNITTTSAANFLLGIGDAAWGLGQETSITGPASPWTNQSSQGWTFGSSSSLIAVSGYQITSSTGTYAYNGTTGSGSVNYVTIGAFSALPPTVTLSLPTFRSQTAIAPIIPSTSRTLIMSIASIEGIDSFNNWYPEGVGVTGSLGEMNLSPTKNLLAVYGPLAA